LKREEAGLKLEVDNGTDAVDWRREEAGLKRLKRTDGRTERGAQMPYASDAQRRYFNANKAELAAQGVDVDEWNASSRGKKLPERAGEGEAADAAEPKRKKKQRTKESVMFVPGPLRFVLDAVEKQATYALLGRIVGRGVGDGSVLGEEKQGEAQSGRAGCVAPQMGTPDGGGEAEAFDAVKVALAVRRRDELVSGPARRSWLNRRACLTKEGFAPPMQQQPASVSASPASAYDQLMSMIRPGPPVPMAGQGGTGLPTATPGGEFGGQNTPSTNPIGLMSGLGKDPGGSSVMGNAAFGTANSSVMKGAAAYGQSVAGATPPSPPSNNPAPVAAQPVQPASPTQAGAAAATTGVGRAAINRQLAAAPKPAPQRPMVPAI
jgi:hypothetical protein